MRNCYECGSEIAEIDVFCPFCGITQKPVPAENEEAVQDQTIAVSQSELADLIGNKKRSENIPTSADNSGSRTDSETRAETRENAKPKNVTSENWAEKTDSIDIPGQVIADIEETPDNVPTKDYFKWSEESKSEEKDLLETDDSGVPNLLPSDSTKSVSKRLTDSSQADSERSLSVAPRLYSEDDSDKLTSPEKESQSGDLLEIQGETPKNIENSEAADNAGALEHAQEDSSQEPEIDFSATIPYTPENVLIHSGKIKKSEAEFQKGKAEPEKVKDQPIQVPEEPIELSEEENTQFDSVKIIQDSESDANPWLKNAGRPDSFPPQKQESAKPAEVKSAKEGDGRGFTKPNIGGSDTEGGRKGGKLKPLEEGTVLNSRYEIVRKIGGGGMGAVYLAADRNLGGILRAVKEMVQSYIEETAQDKAISDFKRESMLLTSLDHPSIPTIYDYFYDEKEARFYLVMKYISGGDLASRLRSAAEGRIEEESVTEWAIQIADVLDYLHNRQPPIVYRDLKPSNIMIDGNTGRAMLIDFGIARWINKEEKGVTAVGTMGYAPPELFSGNVEPRSDIYSLGSTMFHLLTGADPQNNPLLIFDFQKHPRPRQINPQLSDQMEKILMRAVEYNADNRFKSAAEMKRALTEHLQNLQSGRITFGKAKTPLAVSLDDQFVFCGFCGQKIVATDLFCAFCGSKQPLAQKGVNLPGYIAPQPTAKLMIINTSDLDTPEYNLEKDDNLVGRRDPLSNIFPEIDLSKFDPQTKVSRRHARIWREGGQFFIEDLKSSNGTVVIRAFGDSFRLIPHQPHPLTNGEQVKVGDTTLRFVIA